MFVIEDEAHAEQLGRYATRAEALAELDRLARTPWDAEPNLCPCTNWSNCGRHWQIRHFDTAATPWRLLSDEPALDVSAAGVRWHLPTAPARS